MAEEPVSFSELLAGYGTLTIEEGSEVESVFALLKVRAEDGSPGWSVRSGGIPLASEELMGVLDGLTDSIRRKLARSWKPNIEPAQKATTGDQSTQGPVAFSDLFTGLQTVGVGDGYLIESVFAVIKARRPGGVGVWHVRSSEMKLGSQELLGALDGYAATVRDELAKSWNW